MVERMIIIKTSRLNDYPDVENNQLSKDSILGTDSQKISDLQSGPSKSDEGGLQPINLKRRLFGIVSPSIDSINDGEGPTLATALAKKIEKKERRATEQLKKEQRKSAVKVRPWYTKVDVTKPIMCVGIIIILYYAWRERDVWTHRLLTSNTRIRHIELVHVEKVHGKDNSPPPPPSPSLLDNSTSANLLQKNIEDDDDDDNDDNNNNKNTTATNNANTDHTSTTNQDEITPTPIEKSTKAAPQKLNVRIRRAKMSFSNKDRGGKKRGGVKTSTIAGDDYEGTEDAEDIEADEILNDDDIPVIQPDIDEPSNKPAIKKEIILPSSTESSHKNRRQNQNQNQNQRNTQGRQKSSIK
ncbi:unnamed protein product [Adineta steineri]|uniref:Uncharacterized protein n=1 Tax=Adineta steineri TaxID=433720 RepID=A0A815ARE4_9BILA|nr:unnamed protein product [Adineta steineri]CAF4199348.1 unnamed protein product [Adineta steineri]